MATYITKPVQLEAVRVLGVTVSDPAFSYHLSEPPPEWFTNAMTDKAIRAVAVAGEGAALSVVTPYGDDFAGPGDWIAVIGGKLCVVNNYIFENIFED